MSNVREGKTRKDKARGHKPGLKNIKPDGVRGHLFGMNKPAWVKKLSRQKRGK